MRLVSETQTICQKLSHLSYDRRRSNRTALPNCHTGQNSDITPNPAILLNGDLASHLRPLRTISYFWIEWMGSREERDTRGDQRSRSNSDFASIQNCAIEIDVDIFTQFDIRAVVDTDRAIDPCVLREKLLVFFGCGSWWWEGCCVADDTEGC